MELQLLRSSWLHFRHLQTLYDGRVTACPSPCMLRNARGSPSCSLGTLSCSICETARSNPHSPNREATSPAASTCAHAGWPKALDTISVTSRTTHWHPSATDPDPAKPEKQTGLSAAMCLGPARHCWARRRDALDKSVLYSERPYVTVQGTRQGRRHALLSSMSRRG